MPMDNPHQLEILLQFLVTDASSVTHISYILDHLSPSCLGPSPHLQKWITRVTSLMHSKDPAARWAAICIAYRMSSLSKSLLIDNAESWIGTVFPSLSKAEPAPILRASMRYLSLVLCTAEHNLEFQRQVAIPAVPKVSSALLSIAEKHDDPGIKTTSVRTLTQLIPLYPSLHKALSQRLLALCRQTFSGSVHYTMDDLLGATADLYAVLHFLGGKVGAANLWRTYLDEVLQHSWSAWLNLRTTFPASAQLSHKFIGHLGSDVQVPNRLSHADASGSPLTIVALNLDSLKCGVSAIAALLRAPVNRPVRVPIGHLASFCWCLLASTPDDEGPTHIDSRVRVAESAVIPQIWLQTSRLLSCLAQASQDLLAPHAPKLIMIISSHLEKNLEWSERHSLLRCAYHLLYFCPVVGATLGINRLLKATISILSPLYLHQARADMPATVGQSKVGKKRRRDYEPDNVLSVPNATVCATSDECNALIAALDVVDQCMLHAELVASTRSLANRVLLSVLLSLPSIPPSRLASNLDFHGKVMNKIRNMCVASIQGDSPAMSKGTGLVLRSFSSESLMTRDKIHSHVDLLLHPRRPPLVRTLPFVESLSLSTAEEGAEETATRHCLGLTFGNGDTPPITNIQNRPEPVNQSSFEANLAPLGLLQEGKLLNSVLVPQTHAAAATTSTVPPVEPPLAEVPAESLLPISQKVPSPTSFAVPMLVDDSDHEEMPTIDVGSDSDSEV